MPGRSQSRSTVGNARGDSATDFLARTVALAAIHSVRERWEHVLESADMKSYPLVSIVTPLYNNRDHLGECIESVLTQTYPNWDYTIVNNCSTDGSEEIARQYAARDRRIRVITNQTFLRAVPNHNLASRQISADSKYCKIVFADDWISPECVEAIVAVAEKNPSV